MSWQDRFYQMKYDEPGARFIWEPMTWRTTRAYPVARRDPIFTPLFTSIFSSSLFGFSAATAGTLAAGAAAIATTALSIGIQYLLAPKPPKPEDGRVPKVQSVPYRQWGVGRNRVGGAYMLWEAVGKYLYAVQAIAGHRIKSVNRYWLHDDEVTLRSTGQINTGTNYRGNVTILHRLGLVPETAYSEIVSRINDATIWSSNHRGDGQASLGMIVEGDKASRQAKTFPYGAPQLTVEADLALCWDFRDELQDPEDPETWTWTRNSAVIMAWHQCFNEFGHRRDYKKAILPVLDMWKEEADVCDELVALKGGGYERRYECNGFDTTENDPKAGTNAILASCDGWICERGDGALLFIVGKFREKYVTTLTDADLVGHQIEYDVLFEDECNRLIPKFTYPEIGYGTSDTDFFEDTGAQITAGRVLAQEANYQWVQQWRQARRLGIRDWRRLQEKVKGQLNVRLSGINSVYSRWVRINAPIMLPKLNGKIVENRKSILSLLQGGFTMDIMKHPDNIDDWNPETDEGQQPPVPPKTASGEIPTPVINLVQAKPSGDSVYIRVVIIDPEDDSLTPTVRYRVADAGSGIPGAWVEQRFENYTASGGYIDLATQIVPANKLLDIQAAFIASDDDYGDWSVTANITSTIDPVAPAALTSFTQTAASPHLGNAVFSLATPNDSHIKTVKLYRKASGAGLNVNTDTPIATLNVSALGSYSYTDGDATRTNLLSNPGFDSDTVWTKGTGWSIGSGFASHPSGSAGNISQTVTLTAGKYYRTQYDILGSSNIASLTPSLLGGTTQAGTPKQANGTFRDRIAAVSGNNAFGFAATVAFVGALDNAILIEETATSAPQGVWDYYAVPFNGSGVAGPSSGPVTVTIV